MASQRDEHVLRRADQAAAGAGGVVVRERFIGVARQPFAAGCRIVDHDEGVLGQEVEEAFEPRLEQRSEAFGAGRHEAAQQRIHQLVHVALGDALVVGQRPDLVGPIDDAGALEQQLARRRADHAAEAALGALAGGIELADRLHLVAEQLDANGSPALGREDIEDAAAHRQLAALLDERHAGVAGAEKRLDQHVAVDGLPDLEVDRAGAHGVPRGNARGEGRPRRHHDGRRLARRHAARSAGRRQQPVEHVHALGHHEGLGREAVEGRRVVSREGAQARVDAPLTQHRAQILEQRVARLGGGREAEQGTRALGANQLCDHRRAASAAKAREMHGAAARLHAFHHIREIAQTRAARLGRGFAGLRASGHGIEPQHEKPAARLSGRGAAGRTGRRVAGPRAAQRAGCSAAWQRSVQAARPRGSGARMLLAVAPYPLLRLRGLSVRYGATIALGGVDLDVLPGTVHAVVGENGAGKSTLLRALAGLAGRVAGGAEILGEGRSSPQPERGRGARRRLRAAGADALQPARRGRAVDARSGAPHPARLRLAPGAARAGGAAPRGARRRDRSRRARRRAAGPERKLLQIARALASEPQLLLLDEPSAVLDAQVALRVARLARAWSRRGRSVLLVSHHVEDVLQQADVVTVLRDGAVVSTSPAAELDPPELLRRMVGRELPPRETIVAADHAAAPCSRSRRRSASRCARARCWGSSGWSAADARRVSKRWRDELPGAALVPEDRATKGLVPTFSLRENVFLPARYAWLQRRRERREAQAWMERLRIRAAGPDAPIGSLSGGNQQKVLLARALARNPGVLLLDEPTQGVDVAAKAEIHALVRGLARQGTAIVLSSSDLPELLGLAHRIAVVRSGELAGVLLAAAASEEALLALACGVAA